MWLFEKRGFVSVVAYDPSKDTNKKSRFAKIARLKGTHLLVRSRIEEDLDMLKVVVPNLRIETDKSADYSFRCVVTRRQFKKFLNLAVDGITYDSHFKEAARDNSKGSPGRYSAYMSVWSTMAGLQPHSPYGGYSYGGGSTSGSYWSGKSGSSSTTGGGKATPKSPPNATMQGYASIDDWWDALVDGTKETAFNKGMGPRSGFRVAEAVEGYFGIGTVTQIIAPKKAGSPQQVQVEHEDPITKRPTKRIYLSNYLNPVSEWLNEDEAFELTGQGQGMLALEGGDTTRDIEWLFGYLRTNLDVHNFDPNLLDTLDFDACELLTRVQESTPEGQSAERSTLVEIFEDLRWEVSTSEEKIRIATEESVPEKFAQEAVNLLSETD